MFSGLLVLSGYSGQLLTRNSEGSEQEGKSLSAYNDGHIL